MKFADYGRNVYKMIQYAKTIEDREKRTRAAEVIVGVMGQVNPHARESADYKRKLWDHLMILADWELDVDCPYELTRKESVVFHPKSLKRQRERIRYRHYGRGLEKMIERVAEYEDGEEKEILTALLAAQMKRSYATWNHSLFDGNGAAVENDDIISRQMQELSNGKLALGNIKITFDGAPVSANINDMSAGKKRKKRKKAKQAH